MSAYRAGRLRIRHNLHLGVGFLAATSGDLLVNAGISSATYVVLSASGAGADILLNGAVSGNSEVGLSAGGSIGQSAATDVLW